MVVKTDFLPAALSAFLPFFFCFLVIHLSLNDFFHVVVEIQGIIGVHENL